MKKSNGILSRTIAQGLFTACMIAAFAFGCSTYAKVTRVEVIKRADWASGRSLGRAGAYEMIHGRAHYAVDPKDPANKAIADVSLAPRNQDGLVEFSGDFLVLRPKDLSKARGTVLFEVANRGGSTWLFFFRPAAGQRFDLPDPSAVTGLDDAFLFDQGFTLVWAGWQFDIPQGRGIRLNVPVADVSGTVRAAYIHNAARSANTFSLTREGGYCAADVNQADAELTVRDRIDSPPTIMPRNSWAFAKDEMGKAVADPCSVRLTQPFERGRLYEVTYRAQGSPVAGLGFAAVRDFISYLKHGPQGATLRERPETLSKVIGFGLSQSARFLRNFVYDGFNADESKRKVFDGLLVTLAGAGRGGFNHRFALPGEAGNSVLHILRPVDLFPFTDSPQRDPRTGARGGLLDQADRQKVTPKIFYIYSSTEYWARVGSLTHTNIDGTRDLPLHPSTRLYFVAGTPHAPRSFPPRRNFGDTEFEYLANAVAPKYAFRALLMGMDSWVASGITPPASAYPTLKSRELVPLRAVKFPKLPGIDFPTYMPRNWRMNFGADFVRAGIMNLARPVLSQPYTVLLPQVDADGNEASGIRLPHVAVPVATYTGWNYELPRNENLGYLGGLTGAVFPFARTAEERAATKDPRPSVVERYGTRENFLAQTRVAAQSLVKQRYLLATDVDEIEQQAGRLWDSVMGNR